jgi:GNAT superfamily N-acetyltransferase
MQIRAFQPADTPILMQLFYDTVHQVNCCDYTPDQLDAWAPQTMSEVDWRSRLSQPMTLVAVQNAEIVGFCELALDGHIGCFYCHYQHQGQGVGTALLDHIEAIARQQSIPRLYTEASITARPFFERRGFETLGAQQVRRQGIVLRNYTMQKILKI